MFGYGGKQVRDNIHSADLVEAFVQFHAHPRAGAVYNIGGGTELTNLELTQRLLAAMGADDSMVERVPDRKGLQLLLELHGAPLLATTFIPAGESEPLNDPEEIRDRYEKVLDAIVDAGGCPQEPTTVVDLTPMGTGGDPEVVREGRGSLQALGL